MKKKELKKLAIYFVNKGYTTMDDIYYSDDLYKATEEEKDECMDYITDIIDNGMSNFKESHGLL
jgi:hypothetical protein